jgi:hypothetical protein
VAVRPTTVVPFKPDEEPEPTLGFAHPPMYAPPQNI